MRTISSARRSIVFVIYLKSGLVNGNFVRVYMWYKYRDFYTDSTWIETSVRIVARGSFLSITFQSIFKNMLYVFFFFLTFKNFQIFLETVAIIMTAIS